MKIRWTIILLLINVLLFWGIAEQFVRNPAERAFDSQVRSFLPLSKNDWDGVGVKTQENSWEVSRDRWGNWWLKQPFEWPAKVNLVSRMNGTLVTLSVDSAFAVDELARTGQNLASYGLETPRAVLEVKNGTKTLSYKIGNNTPLGNKLYVLSADGKEVWVVDSSINEYLAYTPAQLKQEGFFPFSLVELEALDVQNDDKLMRFERKKGTSAWQLTLDGQQIPLAPGLWESALGKLSGAPLKEKKDPATADLIFTAKTQLTFQTLYARRVLEVAESAKATDETLVRWDGAKEVFRIPASALSFLNAESFLDTHPLSLSPDKIKSLDWTSDGITLSLRKLEDGHWRIISSGVLTEPSLQVQDKTVSVGELADDETVEKILEELCAQVAVPKLVSKDSPATISAITGVVETLRLQDDGPAQELSITRGKNAVTLASLQKTVAYDAPSWPKRPNTLDLLDKKVTSALPGVITSLSLKTASGQTKTFAPQSPEIEAVRSILQSQIRAKRWVDGASVSINLPENKLKYRLDILSEDKSLSFEFWKKEDVWQVQLVSAARAFVPEDSFAAVLDALSTL